MRISLVDELNASTNAVVDCVRFSAAWIACIDHEFSSVERDAILALLPDRIGGMPLARMVEHIQSANRSNNYAPLASVFIFIREQLADESRDALISLVVAIAAADVKVSVGEKHALMFLADLVGCSGKLAVVFEEVTGLSWSDPADLSDPAHWENLERARRQRDEASSRKDQERNRQRGASAARPDAARIEALAILGLVGSPSQDEIRTSFRRLAKLHHPDRYQGLGAEAIDHATRTFQRIQSAYDRLKA